MSETLIGVLVGSFVTIVGILVEQFFSSKKQAREEQRWFADHFLDRKIEAFTSLYAELIEWHRAINFHGNMHPSTFEQYMSNVDAKRQSFINKMVLAEIYVNPSQREKIRTAFAQFTLASQAILFSLPKDELERSIGSTSISPGLKELKWKEMEEAYKSAVEVFAEALNPNTLNDVWKPNRRG